MILHILKQTAKGQSLARILMNDGLRDFSIQGKVLDIGGGRSPDYFRYMGKAEGSAVTISDMRHPDGSGARIDFESDPLPYPDGSFDQALMFNILEHIYHHQFLAGQAHRILKQGGTLIGFVPFMVRYHPDPHDYFRYTKEALMKILDEAGFHDIEIREVGRGPFAVNYNTIVHSVPVAARLLMLPIHYFLDSVYMSLRADAAAKFPLGYIFSAKK